MSFTLEIYTKNGDALLAPLSIDTATFSERLCGTATATVTVPAFIQTNISGTISEVPLAQTSLPNWARVQILYNATVIWNGFLESITWDQFCATIQCTGFLSYARRKILTRPSVIATKTVASWIQESWADVELRNATGISAQSTNTDLITRDEPFGLSFADVLHEFFTLGYEWQYLNNTLKLEQFVGDQSAQHNLRYRGGSAIGNTICIDSSITHSYSDTYNMVAAAHPNLINQVALASINNNEDEIGLTQYFSANSPSDLSQKSAEYVKQLSEQRWSYEMMLHPEYWQPGEIQIGDSVWLDIETDFTPFNRQEKARIVDMTTRVSSEGVEISIVVSTGPIVSQSFNDLVRTTNLQA